MRSSGIWRIILAVALSALLLPEVAAGYVGPGAGFAVVSSFLALFIATLYSILALIAWPFRLLIRLLRRRKAYGEARVKRVVVIGLDGMDPKLAARYMDEGKLPHLAALRQKGTFSPLATTCPPISPVAWSTFLTGVNPGKHNIYDFLARDPHTYLPFLSSVQIGKPKRVLRIGKYQVPLGRPQIKKLRGAKPFWHYLGEAGVFCSVIRVPITFPPEKFPGVLLSGMCVPDIKGSQGTFSFHTTQAAATAERQSGVVVPIERNNGHFRSYVPGPENTVVDGGGELRVPFSVHPAGPQGAEIEVDGKRFTLQQGEYSEWIELQFRPMPGMAVDGICRFYLKQLQPELEVYVTPVHINPMKPSLPISHPLTYSIYLSKLLGPFATLGLAEDTWGLNEDAIGDDAFLEQCYSNHAEREGIFFDALQKTARGLCVCVWDTTDRVQHMFWRYTEKDHPAARRPGADPQRYAGVIEDLYGRMDDLVGRTLQQVDDATLLLVISDHGFASFARGVNLNSWLRQQGYLTLRDGAQESSDWFSTVDWSRTRAYAMGLNGIYVNQRGRERHGVVPEGAAAEALKAELSRKLRGLVDPQSGRVAVTEAWTNQSVYSGPYRENSPDLVVGYSQGYRASWDCVMGRVSETIFDDNTKAWSGDHCIDARLVPGILFSNKKIAGPEPALADLAPTILDLFGLPQPPHFDGKRLTVTL